MAFYGRPTPVRQGSGWVPAWVGGWVSGCPCLPVALRCISHISPGEHPPPSTVLGMALCGALPAPAWEGTPGGSICKQSGHRPLAYRVKLVFSGCWGWPSGLPICHIFWNPPPSPHPTGEQPTHLSASGYFPPQQANMYYTRKYPAAYLMSLPPPAPPLLGGILCAVHALCSRCAQSWHRTMPNLHSSA